MEVLKKQFLNARQRREINLLQELDHPNILSISLLDKFNSTNQIKELNLIRLKEIIEISPLKEKVIISLAIEVLKGLDYLWKKNIVFNNLSPNSILVNIENNIVKIADFKDFSELKNESISDYRISSLKADLQFISPELTGRMNRSVDFRSDIYSLGAILYYCMTGKYLFQEKESHRIIHCHLAKTPELISSEISIHSCFEKVIFKMLAKNPRDRYQTTSGLEFDLKKCLEGIRSLNTDDDFVVGEFDSLKTFRLDENLHGRGDEISKLMFSYKSIINKRSRLFLISGQSGIGKTALVNEVKKPMTQHHATFIQGKFDQLKRNIPFYGFHFAINQLIDQLYTERSERVEEIRQKIIAGLGENLRIIASIIPSVKKFTGYKDKSGDGVKDSHSDSLNLFYTTFSLFFSYFKDSSSPLVIFLDDLQWADSSTMGLIKYLLTDIRDLNLLIIAGYRDNEVTSNHPWHVAINEIKENDGLIDEIVVDSLKVKDVGNILENSFNGLNLIDNSIAQIIWSKSGGNPFYIQNLIKAFYESGFIYFDESSIKWKCDIVKVMESDISPNLIGLILNNFKKLPLELLSILKSASAIGTHFSAKLLKDILGISNELCSKAMHFGLEERIILAIDTSYRYIKWEDVDLDAIKFKFSHDKLQQALYEDLSDSEKLTVHYKVAQVLYTSADENIFELAFHYNKLLNSSFMDIPLLVKINFDAGLKAYASSAFESAKTFFEISYTHTTQKDWDENYTNTLKLATLLFECCYLSNDEIKAQELNDFLLKKVQTLEDKSRVYEVVMNFYSQKGRANEAIEIGAKALKLYGINFPKKTTMLHIFPKLVLVKTMLLFKSESSLLNAKVNTNQHSLSALRILSNMTPSCFIQSPESFILNSLYCLLLALRNGNSDVSSFAFSLFGIIEANEFHNVEKAKKIMKLAMRMNEKFNSKNYLPKIIFAWDNFVQFLHGPIRESLPWLSKGHVAGIESGDFNFANYCTYARLSREIFLGQDFKVLLKSVVEFSQFSFKVGDNLMIPLAQVYRRYVSSCTGFNDEKYLFLDSKFDEKVFLELVDSKGDLQSRTFYFVFEMITLFFEKKYKEALNIAIELDGSIVKGTQKQIIFYEYHFYRGLILAHVLRLEDLHLIDLNTSHLKILLTKSLSILKKIASQVPENFNSRYCLLHAQYSQTKGLSDETTGSYNRAIIYANQSEMVLLEALAYELYSDYLRDLTFLELANSNYMNALLCYERIKFTRKIDQINNLDQLNRHSTSLINENLFKEVIVQFSNLISNSKGIETLLTKLNEQILYYSNAQRSMIIIKTDKGYKTYSNNENHDFCLSVVDYTYNSSEPVRISDASSFHPFVKDQYFVEYKITSLATFSLVANNEIQGVIYLENNLIRNAFDHSKTKVVEILSSQVALAIENAFFVDELEEKVTVRTKLLENKRIELENSNSEKEVLVRVLCHDLANIVTVKSHSVRALEKILESSIDENIAKYFDKMKTALKHESYIINNVRTLEMAKNKLLKVELSLVDLFNKINEMAASFEERLLEKNIKLEIDSNLKNLEVVAEDTALSINVLNNILSNAIKFSFKDSKIRVYLVSKEYDKVTIAIQDFGIGMDKSFLANLFKSDVHHSTSGTSNEKGTGFGLNIIKVFMHKFGGSVSVSSLHRDDSPKLHGTTFKLTFLTK